MSGVSGDMTGETAATAMHRHQNDGMLERTWERNQVDGVDFAGYVAAASVLGALDAAWARTLTSCTSAHPCGSCCLRALRAVEAYVSQSGSSLRAGSTSTEPPKGDTERTHPR